MGRKPETDLIPGSNTLGSCDNRSSPIAKMSWELEVNKHPMMIMIWYIYIYNDVMSPHDACQTLAADLEAAHLSTTKYMWKKNQGTWSRINLGFSPRTNIIWHLILPGPIPRYAKAQWDPKPPGPGQTLRAAMRSFGGADRCRGICSAHRGLEAASGELISALFLGEIILEKSHTHAYYTYHTHTHIYIYMYIQECMYMCI